MAIPLRGSRDPRISEQVAEESKGTVSFSAVKELCFPGCVIVSDGGGELSTSKFGEMTSWNVKRACCRGLVIDGFIRDLLGLEAIPDFTICARGTSPIESYKNWRIQAVNCTIAMPGTLTSQVTVSSGDWIVGGPDGVIVVPRRIAMETLV